MPVLKQALSAIAMVAFLQATSGTAFVSFHPPSDDLPAHVAGPAPEDPALSENFAYYFSTSSCKDTDILNVQRLDPNEINTATTDHDIKAVWLTECTNPGCRTPKGCTLALWENPTCAGDSIRSMGWEDYIHTPCIQTNAAQTLRCAKLIDCPPQAASADEIASILSAAPTLSPTFSRV